MLTIEQIDSIDKEFEDRLGQVQDAQALETLRVEFLGKKGKLTLLLRELGTIPTEDRLVFGKRINDLKNHAESQITEYSSKLTSGPSKKSEAPANLPL